MRKIAVIGAGTMGIGVAQNFAQEGLVVILLDISEEKLDYAKKEISQNVRFHTLFNKNKIVEESEKILSRIKFSTDYQLLEQVDFVVENVPEIWEIKKFVYEKIDKICPDNCIFLVNTSCIPITKIAALTNRAEKFIGTHFMNPVPLMTTIEVIKGYHTSEDTIIRTKELLKHIGKECIIVNDLPGFVSNRISHLFMNEAAFVVQDQVAEPKDVDNIFKKCYGHKMGPLETADLIGLDTVVNSLDVLYQNFQDSKYRCCPLLRKMVDAGLYGKKSGQGFYSY
ncbi:3-hydroxyacyl-CoA dehydrogenase family protein [Solibacillus sp. CAU 1738]|uniref:3-hydroxyacyl-CoA dehydrogenase family protein n=1 Tax=Solibacillus sp. CAU 1738 TaxID=3140363 RepID=UPI0032601106